MSRAAVKQGRSSSKWKISMVVPGSSRNGRRSTNSEIKGGLFHARNCKKQAQTAALPLLLHHTPRQLHTVTRWDGEGKVTSEKQNQRSLRVWSKPRSLLEAQHRLLAAGSVAGKLQLTKLFQKQSAVSCVHCSCAPQPSTVLPTQTLLPGSAKHTQNPPPLQTHTCFVSFVTILLACALHSTAMEGSGVQNQSSRAQKGM